MRVTGSAFSLLGICLLSFLPLAAQTPDTSAIRGRVLDQTQAAVAGAEITITNQQTQLARTVQTDATGHFVVPGLVGGETYDIVARKSGFADASVKDVVVAGGGTASVSLQLNAAADKVAITVTGEVGGVRTDMPQIGDRLGEQQVQETPLLNRRITYLPLLSATRATFS